MTYYVLGIECLKSAEVHGQHENKKVAFNQAAFLERTKGPLCCQNYAVLTGAEIKKQKLNLYSRGCVITC